MPDVRKILAKVAPTLAQALGGPLAASAVSFIGRRLGLKVTSPDELEALVADPEQLARLAEAEREFRLELERIAQADRASARAREMEVRDHTPRILAYALTAGFFLILLGMLFLEMPEGSREALYIMLGALASAYTAVVAYYFGSSAGSSRKNDIFDRLLDRTAQSGP